MKNEKKKKNEKSESDKLITGTLHVNAGSVAIVCNGFGHISGKHTNTRASVTFRPCFSLPDVDKSLRVGACKRRWRNVVLFFSFLSFPGSANATTIME